MATPNMGLEIPVPGVTAGGTGATSWAGEISADLQLIEEHDHSPGKGATLSPSDATLTAMTAARIAGDTLLQSNLDAEALTRQNADARESVTRANADSTEAAARIAADNAEASARAAADAAIIASGAMPANVAIAPVVVGTATKTVQEWTTLFASDVFVDSVAGNDANDGFTIATPKKTFAAALALVRSNGTVWMKGGSRFREVSDVYTKPFNVKMYGGGARPIFDASKSLLNGDFVDQGGNVYRITVNYQTLFGFTPTLIYSQSFMQMFEGPPGHDTRLVYANGHFDYTFDWQVDNTDWAGQLAYVGANPGSFAVCKSDGTPLPTSGNPGDEFYFYVHLPDSGNPITNGKEYSVSNPEEHFWWQKNGGVCENVWFTRSGHRNGVNFEGVQGKNLRIDQYPVHGVMSNSCRFEDSASYGVYKSGACWHGFRETASIGTDLGQTYVRCHAEEGAWGFYSHGSGGGVAPNLFVDLEDCSTYHVVIPHELYTTNGLTAKGCSHLQATVAVRYGADDDLYEDCHWDIEVNAPDMGQGVFSYAHGTMRNCMITGGTPAGGQARLTAYSYGMTLENCSILCVSPVEYSTGNNAWVLKDTIWPGTAGIVSATNCYLKNYTLDKTGTSLTVPAITGCFGPVRQNTYDRQMYASGTGGWVPVTLGSTWAFTFGSTQVTVTKSPLKLSSLLAGDAIKITNYDGLGNDFISQIVSFGTRNSTTEIINFADAAGATSNAVVTGYDVLRATVKIWPQVTGLWGRPDKDMAGFTLYAGAAADLDAVVAGTPVELSVNVGSHSISAGIYVVQTVTADAGGPRLTFDRSIVLPMAYGEYALTKPYDNKSGGAGWQNWHSTPRMEVNILAGRIIATALRLVLPVSGLAITAQTSYGYIGPFQSATAVPAVPPVQTSYIDNPYGYTEDITVQAQVVGDCTGVAALTLQQNFFDMALKLTPGGEKKLRVSEDSYIYGMGVGCDL